MSKLSLKPESKLLQSVKSNQFYEPIKKQKKTLVTNMISTVLNHYDITDEELDIFKELYVKLYEKDNDIECEMSEKINNNTRIYDLILYMFSKTKTNITSLYQNKTKNYLNIEEETTTSGEDNREDNKDDISIKQYEKYMYNLSKLNHHIDFTVLGNNVYSNHRRIKGTEEDEELIVEDDEFEEIPL